MQKTDGQTDPLGRYVVNSCISQPGKAVSDRGAYETRPPKAANTRTMQEVGGLSDHIVYAETGEEKRKKLISTLAFSPLLILDVRT